MNMEPWTVYITPLIDLTGGILLLLAAYYALMSRRSDQDAYRKAYGRAVLQYAAAFLIISYTGFVLWPSSQAWPVQTGEHLYLFFLQMETVLDRMNGQLTAYYRVLLQQIGYATGTGTTVMPGILGMVESGVHTIGLIIYTVVFAVISLGAQVPTRIAHSLQNAVNNTEDQL